MLMMGDKITDTENLKRTQWSGIYDMITNGTHQLKKKLSYLRTIKTIDEKRYQIAKRDLPYFTTAIFHPPHRKKEHFASASGLVLDLDHVATDTNRLNSLRSKIRENNQVVLDFVSPGGEGIKIGMKFLEPIYDAGLYTDVYKKIAWRWAKKFDLLDYMDFSTSDVTRATFLSYDPSAYYNPNAEGIDYSQIIDEPHPDNMETREDENQDPEKTNKKSDPSSVIHAIKERLNTGERATNRDSDVYVPPEVEDSIKIIEKELASFDIELIDTEPIQYGRKIKAAIPNAWTEVNVFYGKKGFSVVITPKKGSNTELGDAVKKIIKPVLRE